MNYMNSKFYKPIFACLFFLLSVYPFLGYTQVVNQQVLAQVRSTLSSKGITEQEAVQALNSKGINIYALSETELLAKRTQIEQIISELAAQKKDKVSENSTPTINSMVNTNVSVSTIEQKAEQQQEKFLSTLPESAIYGHQIFRDKSLDIYRVSKDASPPESYILAPGDKLNILIFGRSQADLQYEINSSGFIQPSQMPKIFLNGLNLKQAKELIANRFSTYYVFNRDQFALTLNTSRTLNVNIFGEVEKAASYTTSALNTALNVLAASGGPNELGSVRAIQIIRGSTKKILDVYAFMRNPILQFDFFLQNNDIIYVPRAEILVSLQGAINRPMRYELKAGETLKDLIDYAGGLNDNTYTNSVQVERFENNEVVLKDYDLQDVLQGKSKFIILNGDIIRFKTINNPLKQFVKINGSVSYPGEYDLTTSPTLSTLLSKSTPKLDATFGYIYRTSFSNPLKTEYFPFELDGPGDFKLQANDAVVLLSKDVYQLESDVKVLGEVKSSLKLRYDATLTITDLLKLAGGANYASDLNRVDVFRLNFKESETPTRSILTLSLDKQYNLLAPNQNFQLQPFDMVVVRAIPEFSMQETLQLGGEVKRPGQYSLISKRYTFSELLEEAGGLTDQADIINTTLIRYQAGAGIVVFDATQALLRKGNIKFDPILLPNDYITIPKRDNTIFINTTATNYVLPENQKSLQILYQGSKSAVWYIRKFAGGFATNANKKFITVTRKNGQMLQSSKFLGLINKSPRVQFGDLIRVGIKVDKQAEKLDKKPFDWDKFLTKVISVATVFALITNATK